MAPRTVKTPHRLVQEVGFGEPARVLVAGTSVTAVLAALLVESPGTSPILWSLLFIPAALAGYCYREKGSSPPPCSASSRSAIVSSGATPIQRALPVRRQ
jgi:hypothetical protein